MPSWQEAQTRGTLALPKTCDQCRKTIAAAQRQMLSCAYEPITVGDLLKHVRVTIPPGATPPHALDPDEKWPTVCPGYSTSLPEVIEVARSWLHWSKGALRAFTGTSGPPSEALVEGVEIFNGAVLENQAWCMDNPVKKD